MIGTQLGAPHWFGTPPPPHVVPTGHGGQVIRFPQPSPVCPHWMPCWAHVSGVHDGAPHLFATPPPPQVCPAGHGPHVRTFPQPSGTVPHSAPSAAHVLGVQSWPPHWLGTPPPPQVCGYVHSPQLAVTPPQPSLCGPQRFAYPGYAQVLGVHVGIVHVPRTAPGTLIHAPPQQSAVVVHEPPFATQTGPQRRTPWLSGTQGSPQQSALDAQIVPIGGLVVQSPTYATRQRGIPSASWRQQFSGLLLQLPEGWFSVSQQLFVVLHEPSPPTLQIWPGSRHEFPPPPQRPNSSVGLSFTQTFGWPCFGSGEPAHPQQSLSTRQSSASGWQPDGLWQIVKPGAAPVLPHAREQHAPSHGPVPLHATTVPAMRQPPTPLPPGSPHVPFWFAPVFAQLPLQHSLLSKQTSPFCAQKETAAEHTPFWQ